MAFWPSLWSFAMRTGAGRRINGLVRMSHFAWRRKPSSPLFAGVIQITVIRADIWS